MGAGAKCLQKDVWSIDGTSGRFQDSCSGVNSVSQHRKNFPPTSTNQQPTFTNINQLLFHPRPAQWPNYRPQPSPASPWLRSAEPLWRPTVLARTWAAYWCLGLDVLGREWGLLGWLLIDIMDHSPIPDLRHQWDLRIPEKQNCSLFRICLIQNSSANMARWWWLLFFGISRVTSQ